MFNQRFPSFSFICCQEELSAWPPLPNKHLLTTCIHTLTCLMSKYSHQSHDLRVFTLCCRPQVNPLRGNTKTGKTVCATNHTAQTLCARWMQWFRVLVGFIDSAFPAFVGVCLEWYAFISQWCPCARPLPFRFLLKDQTLCYTSMSVEI